MYKIKLRGTVQLYKLGNVSAKKTTIVKKDFFDVLLQLRNNPDGWYQDSFLYYALMYAVAARNSAIRDLTFNDFRSDKGKPGFQYQELKTNKEGRFFVLFPAFEELVQ